MARRLLILAVVAVASACTTSSAQTPESSAAASASAADSATADAAWPDDYGDGENGAWSTGSLTIDQIMPRATQEGAKPACVNEFLDAVGVESTLEWTLYLRDGVWLLYGSADGGEPESYDGGRYLMFHVKQELTAFSSFGGHPDTQVDYYLYPRFDEPEAGWLTMNLVETRKRVPDPVSDCFLRAAVAVELTNPFQKVA